MNDGKIIIDKIIAEAEEVAKASLAKGQKEADAVLKAAQEKVNKELDVFDRNAQAEAEKAAAKEISEFITGILYIPFINSSINKALRNFF